MSLELSNTASTSDEFEVRDWTMFATSSERSRSLSQIKDKIIKNNINPFKNSLYKNTDLERLLRQRVKKKTDNESWYTAAVNNVYSPCTVIGDGFITRNGINHNSTLCNASSKNNKHYSHFFEPSGYISDICTLGTSAIVGMLLDGKSKFVDHDLVYTNISNSEYSKCITAYIDIAAYAKVCIHENISSNDVLRLYNIVYIIREGANVHLRRYYTGKNNSSMHLHYSKIIQHPASKLTIENNNNDCYYLQEFFDVTVYQDCVTNINLQYDVKNSNSTHVITDIKHIDKNSISDVSVRSVVADDSKFSFVGNINVNKSAKNIDANLQNKNLQLSSSASIITEPKLNIENKDISCNHGCTVSYVDPQDIYFLNTRGIDTESAKTILSEAFLNV